MNKFIQQRPVSWFPENSSMKFEYIKQNIDVINVSKSSITPNYTEDVNKLGDEGWELVSTVLEGTIVIGYFKRIKR